MVLARNPFIARDQAHRAQARGAQPHAATPGRKDDALRGRTFTGQMRALAPDGTIERGLRPSRDAAPLAPSRPVAEVEDKAVEHKAAMRAVYSEPPSVAHQADAERGGDDYCEVLDAPNVREEADAEPVHLGYSDALEQGARGGAPLCAGYSEPNAQQALARAYGARIPADEVERAARPAAVDARSKAQMREAAEAELILGRRLDLTEDEEAAEGWALLPMLDVARALDADPGAFNTVYHYADADEAAASAYPKGKDDKRGEHLIRLVDGKFVRADDTALDTKGENVPNQTIHEGLRALDERKRSKHGRAATADEKRRHTEKLVAAGGRYIFVMTGAGEFYAGRNIPYIQHHSSFLAGGAVAGAGDMAVAGGELKTLSNTSGHYKPGPAYLWQVCQQLAESSVALDAVQIEVMGARGKFGSAAEFAGAIDPSADPSLFDEKRGLAACDSYLAAKRGARPATQDR